MSEKAKMDYSKFFYSLMMTPFLLVVLVLFISTISEAIIYFISAVVLGVLFLIGLNGFLND